MVDPEAELASSKTNSPVTIGFCRQERHKATTEAVSVEIWNIGWSEPRIRPCKCRSTRRIAGFIISGRELQQHSLASHLEAKRVPCFN